MRSKPEDSRWTDAQWQAITERGHDVLVAAAAGSGKTAVLVERIIQKITDDEHPVSIDDLLVVTFTKAAAAEMRERIGRALEQEVSTHPENLFLRRQQALLGKAPIMTLHAFCKTIIQKYYYFLDLDPGFRLLDGTEAALLREEIMDAVLEEGYGSADPEFFRLVDRYSNDRGDDGLRQLIYKVYDFSLSHPWPDQWIDRMVQVYRVTEETSIDHFSWIGNLKQVLVQYLSGAEAALEEARAVCRESGGPWPYAETLTADIADIRRLRAAAAGDWAGLRSVFLDFSFGKLKAGKSKDIDDEKKERVKKIRDRVKQRIGQLRQQWFARAPEECLQDLHDMVPSVAMLGRLVKAFAQQYKKEKRRKGLLDFSDLEHECLAVLRGDGSAPDREIPSIVAMQYQTRFEEVLVDEYQDTNRVQEAIIQLITKDSGKGGNLFMVGDVKQSIYGFRLAEPGLFIEKYKSFSDQRTDNVKIDLSSNFRSRSEIIDGTNFIFRQTMDETVGGVAYDSAAELRCGAAYPPEERPVELELIDRGTAEQDDSAEGAEDADTMELEASAIADRIAAMTGDATSAFQVYDRTNRRMRPVRFRDIAVLMRSAGNAAAVVKEVLNRRGIPAYTELTTGYFDAIEVTVMLAVLQIIDNPLQDIPLASVLRSPIVGLSGDDLARIRMADRNGDYYLALKKYTATQRDRLADRLSVFLSRLSAWRSMSKTRSVAELIWQIYRDTGYYDYAGALAGGTQRQANLKAFYDRARQYEKTSFRGLFRFLRFIGRMRENGGDLGEARALSEQEDVVRIMTIHKSKGLEFPVVFVAGIGRRFNLRDMSAPALLHKSLGFGTRWIDPDKRMSVPTLPYLAIKEQMKKDALDEEMRILYVALTRAREKLILIGSVRNLSGRAHQWASMITEHAWTLPGYCRSSAMTFLDWIAPCVMRHRSAALLHELTGESPESGMVFNDPSLWAVHVVPMSGLVQSAERPPHEEYDKLERIRHWQTVASHSGIQDEVARRLTWRYPQAAATVYMAKQTVTEIKSQQDYFSTGQDDRLLSRRSSRIGGERPRFMQQSGLSPAERGTALHVLMQHLNMNESADVEAVRLQGRTLVEKEILTPDQEAGLNYEAISDFLHTPIGKKMRAAQKMMRECPFSLVLDAKKVYPSWTGGTEGTEQVLIQGVIDCIIDEPEGLILLDYKTDRLSGRFPNRESAVAEMKRRYLMQLDLYRLAIEKIWRRPINQVGLYAFDIGCFIDLTKERRKMT